MLAATAYIAGRLATRRWIESEGLEVWAVSTALGLVLLAHLFLFLGLLDLLARGPVLVAAVATHILGLPCWREAVAWWRSSPRRLALAAAFGILLVLAPFFLLGLYPPTGFDETEYHLPVARAFARSGGVPFLPELRFPVFPHLANLLFAAMLLFARDTSAHLVDFLSTALTAGILAGWGARLFAPAVGWMAASLFLGYPIVAYLAGTSYVDPSFVLFVTAGLWATDRWRESERSSWLVLAGLFLAAAAGTKYQGLFFVAVVPLQVAWTAHRGRRVQALLAFALPALASLALWYGRMVYHTGDPVFPILSRASPWAMTMPGPGLHERLVMLATLPWDVLFRRQAVGWQPPFSPAFLAGLPLLAVGAVRHPWIRRVVVLFLAYALFLILIPPDARYLIPVVPVLSLALAAEAGYQGDRLGLRWRRFRVMVPLCTLFLLPGWLYALHRMALQGPIPVTEQDRERYLAARFPAYSALRYLNHRRGSGYAVYVLQAENMLYFAEGSFLGDWNGPARFERIVPLTGEPEALHRELRKLKADHLLVTADQGIHLPVDVPGFRSRFRRVYADEHAELFELLPGP